MRARPAHAVFLLRISFNAANQCEAFAQVAPNLGMQLRTDCPTRMEVPVFPSIPAGWIHVELDLDATTMNASMIVGDNFATMPLTPTGPVAGPPDVRIGLLYTRVETPEPAVALDDVVVTIR